MATRITNKLPQFISAVETKAARVVTRALVRGGSEIPANIPVDTSHLLNSMYRVVNKNGTAIVGTLGFTAAYALALTKMPGKLKGLPRPKGRGRYWGPHDGQPDFLVRAFKRAKPDIDSYVKEGMKPS
jgi:hypothetical protein